MCATSAGVKSVALGLSTTGSALASVCECHSILAFSATYKSKNANLTTLGLGVRAKTRVVFHITEVLYFPIAWSIGEH
jgi:hypothetical protein